MTRNSGSIKKAYIAILFAIDSWLYQHIKMGQATSIENRRAGEAAIVCATKHVWIKWTIEGTARAGSLDLSTPETTASTGRSLLEKIRVSYGDSPPAKLKIEVRLASGLAAEQGKNFAQFAGFNGHMPPAAESIGRKIKFVIHPPWMCDGFGHIYDGCLAFCRRAGIDFAWKTIAPPPPSSIHVTDAPGAPGGGRDDDRLKEKKDTPGPQGGIAKPTFVHMPDDVAKYRKYIQSKITKAEAEIEKRNDIIASHGAVTNEHRVAQTAKTGFVADIAANKRKLAMQNPEIEASNDFKEYVARGRARASQPARARAPAAPYVPALGEGAEGNNNANQGGAAPPAAPPAVLGETEKDVEDLLKDYPAFFNGDAPLVDDRETAVLNNRIKTIAYLTETRAEISAQIDVISRDLRARGDEYVNLIVDILKSMDPESMEMTVAGDLERPIFRGEVLRITHLFGARSFLRAKRIFTPDGVKLCDLIFSEVSKIPGEYREATVDIAKLKSIERDMRIMQWVARLPEGALVPNERANQLIVGVFCIMHSADAVIEERVAIGNENPDVLGNTYSIGQHVFKLTDLLAGYLYRELRTDLREGHRGGEGYTDEQRDTLRLYADMAREYTNRYTIEQHEQPQVAPEEAQTTRIGGYKVSKSESSADECIACTEMKRNMVATPCGHVSMCGGCATKLVQRAGPDELTNCPICRAPVVGFYMPYE